MRRIAFVAALAVGGCSIHPLPDFIGPDKTLAIAKRIRCEARDAVKTSFVRKALDSPDKKTRDIGKALSEEETLTFKNLKYDSLDKATSAFFRHYDGTGLAYDFMFDITESGGVGASLDLVRPLTGGTLSAGIGAGGDLTRQNQRTFLLNDTFAGLLTKLTRADCLGVENGENWIYPIEGKIGLEEMVSSFISLDSTGALAKSEGDAAAALVDTLEFTTELSVSAHPSLILTAAGRRWQTTKLAASETGIHATRKDKNKVTVALSVESAPSPSKGPDEKASKSAGRQRTTSERNATKAIFNRKTLQLFSNTIDLSRRFNLPDPQ